MNRNELQQLAMDRIADAKALLDAQRWSGAYYLAGYAVECALKSCVLHYVERTGVIFEERKFQESCWTHELEKLVKSAGLEQKFGIARGANRLLDDCWAVVRKWTETSRYQQNIQADAEKLYEAITQHPNGVLLWLQFHW